MHQLDISLLIAVHIATTHHQLKLSIDSIYKQQGIPQDIIIIQDGPVSKELEIYLDDLKNNQKINQLLALKKNSGLAAALNYGLSYSRCSLIARLDPEDEVINNRFQLQMEYFQNHPEIVILGGQAIEKFNNKSRLIKKPNHHSAILQYMKTRNPLIHSTVMFKKKEINRLGGYPSIQKCQDLYLWINCQLYDYQFANINKPLIQVYLNSDLIKRRDYKYFLYEKEIYQYQFSHNLISKTHYMFITSIRFLLRSLPGFIKIFIYNLR